MLLLACVTLLLSAPCAWSAGSGGKTAEVIGSSRIDGGNFSAAREEAVADSLIGAISRIVAESLPREIVLKQFPLLSDSVFSNTGEFVEGYKVLSESKTGGRYVVLVEVTVNSGRLMSKLDSLGIRAEQKQLPRVLLCVAEREADLIDYRYWWSGQPGSATGPVGDYLTQGLQVAGFPIVRIDPSPEFAAYPALLSPAEALDLGRRAQADVVIVGQAQAEEVNAGGEKSFRGLIELNAYAAETGRSVGQAKHTELVIAANEAAGPGLVLASVASKSAQDLARQIETAWFSPTFGRSVIEMVVSGTGGHVAKLVKLRSSLGRMPGVANVQIKEMRQDAAVLTIEYQGKARGLADALLLQSFDTFSVIIDEVSAGTISLHLVPR